MTPCKFPESNFTFTPPKGMTAEECGELPVLKTQQAIVSCWQMTEEELGEIMLNGGKVWLTVWGHGQPMVNVSAEKPFNIT